MIVCSVVVLGFGSAVQVFQRVVEEVQWVFSWLNKLLRRCVLLFFTSTGKKYSSLDDQPHWSGVVWRDASMRSHVLPAIRPQDASRLAPGRPIALASFSASAWSTRARLTTKRGRLPTISDIISAGQGRDTCTYTRSCHSATYLVHQHCDTRTSRNSQHCGLESTSPIHARIPSQNVTKRETHCCWCPQKKPQSTLSLVCKPQPSH